MGERVLKFFYNKCKTKNALLIRLYNNEKDSDNGLGGK